MRKITFGVGGAAAPPIDSLTRLAQLCEGQGYDSMWWGDHLMGFAPSSLWGMQFTSMAQYQPNPHVFYDPFVAMTAAAAITNRIRLGTLVTEPVRRHPAVLAQSLLSVDHASKGRCIAGIGSGEAMNLEPYGIEFNRPAARLEEALSIIRLLWGAEAPVNFAGQFWQLKDAVLGLGPYQPGKYPPIWVAAHGPRMLRVAGKYGDGWLPYRQMDAAEYCQMLAAIRQSAREHGRDPLAITPALSAPLIVDSDHETCHRLLESAYMKLFALQMVPASQFERLSGQKHPLGDNYVGVSQFIPTRHSAEGLAKAIERVPSAVTQAFFLHGTAEEVVADIVPYIEHGLEHMVLLNMTFAADAAKLRSSSALTLEIVRRLS